MCGVRNLDACTRRLDAARRDGDALDYQLVGFAEHIETLYATATLFVCRAGALTVAELAATGTPAVLVPLPGAPGDHQTRNAMTVADAGAAVVVTDSELDDDRLAQEVDRLLGDPARLAAMGVAAHGLARPDAAARLVDLMEAAI